MKKYYVITTALLLAIASPNAYAMNKRGGDQLEQRVEKKAKKQQNPAARTIQCPYCPEMCANNQTLSKHINRYHLNKQDPDAEQALADAQRIVGLALAADVAYECQHDGCGKKYNDMDGAIACENRHQQPCERQPSKPRRPQCEITRTMQCPYCPEMCANNQTLSRHINTQHMAEHEQALARAQRVVEIALANRTAQQFLDQNGAAIICPTCSRTCASVQGLGVHRNYCKAEGSVPKKFVQKNLVCGGCQRSFTYEKAFRNHELGCALKVTAPAELQYAAPAPLAPGPLQQFGYDDGLPAFGAPREELFPELQLELKYDE